MPIVAMAIVFVFFILFTKSLKSVNSPKDYSFLSKLRILFSTRFNDIAAIRRAKYRVYGALVIALAMVLFVML
jgi:hypothetical protein